MPVQQPTAALDSRFSTPDAQPVPWVDAREQLERAEIYWLTTVRFDGRPHVTPLIAILLDEALYFCTGESEQKARNLATNPRCVITTGCNAMGEGLDVILEGTAVRQLDPGTLQRLADAYAAKYEGWRFTVGDGGLDGEGGLAIVFSVTPDRAFGFQRGETFSQTRWSF